MWESMGQGQCQAVRGSHGPTPQGDTSASSSLTALGREDQWSQSGPQVMESSKETSHSLSLPAYLHTKRCSTAVTWVLGLGDSLQKGSVTFQGHMAQTTH